jgi:hypothetical protein
MIVNTDCIFWMLTACTCRFTTRVVVGLEASSIEQLSSSSWWLMIPWATMNYCSG